MKAHKMIISLAVVSLFAMGVGCGGEPGQQGVVSAEEGSIEPAAAPPPCSGTLNCCIDQCETEYMDCLAGCQHDACRDKCAEEETACLNGC